VNKQVNAFLMISRAALQHCYAYIEVHNIEANIITLFAYAASNNCVEIFQV